MSELLWHYTTLDLFKRLLKQGAILPDRNEPNNEDEIPTVTFSANPYWERTRYRVGRLPSGQVIMMNKSLLEQFCGGLVRIGVKPEVAPMSWHRMKDEVGMSQVAMKGLYDFAIAVGARTSHWFATFDSVPEEKWINVQVMKGDEWIDLPADEIPNLDDVDLSIQPDSVVDIRYSEQYLSNLNPIVSEEKSVSETVTQE